jgi:hypothetical protein
MADLITQLSSSVQNSEGGGDSSGGRGWYDKKNNSKTFERLYSKSSLI